MGAVREIEWDSCLIEPIPTPKLEQRFRRETGRPGSMMRFFEGSSWLSDAVVRLSVQLNTHVYVDAELADEAGLVVSQDNSCRFCFGAQRAFLRVLGMSEARISRLEQNLLVGDFSERERAALDFARRLSRSEPPLSEADVDALRGHGFDRLEVAELSGLIGLHLFFNRLSTFAALPPRAMESFPDQWWVRVARPLMAIRFRRMRRFQAPDPLTEGERVGPFSEIVNALDGHPLAGQLRIIIDGAWNSTQLSKRAVPLVFAVVARALGCRVSEREARRLLALTELTEEQIEEVLTHLSSAALDEVERLAVSFARETVWYQPVRIQQRCREIQSGLSREQFLELLGVVSLANTICRLGVLSGGCR
jgi:alkylhydroperoxidase family enzyme